MSLWIWRLIWKYAPDYKAISQMDDIRPSVYDEAGQITTFYQIGMEEFVPNNGVFLRKDLMEEQGLENPVTYDEYEKVLLKLKSTYNIEAPIFLFDGNELWLSSGKNVQEGFSLDEDGNCVYGPVEDNYREYLKIANKWYDEGLIYHDFYVIPNGQNIPYMIEFMSSGKSVVAYGYNEFAGMIALEEGQSFMAGYIPRDEEDQQVHLTMGVDKRLAKGVAYAISGNASEEEIQNLCMMMNYFYTEEGALFANYGVQGQAFEYRDDGTPWYTDLITANPDGLSQTQALLTYIGYMVPAYADYTKYNISSLTTWADFIDVWSTADNTLAMPEVVLTTEETEKYAKINSDVQTYLDETLVKFFIGDLDVNDDAAWNSYLSELDSLGVQDMIDIYTAALERYHSA